MLVKCKSVVISQRAVFSVTGLLEDISFVLIHSCLVSKLCLTLVTPWTVAHQAPLSMGFSRQEYRSRLPFPSLADLPHPGIEARFALAGGFFTTEPLGKPSYVPVIQIHSVSESLCFT